MKKTAFSVILSALFACLLLFSCKKAAVEDDSNDPNNPNSPNNPCNKLALVHAHPFVAVTYGEEIHLSADSLADADYYWTGPNYFESYSQNNTVSFSAEYTDRGWYYLRVSHTGCTDLFDSVYVNVKFPQGAASCSPANNSANFSGPVLLGNQSFYFLSFGAATGGYGIVGNSLNGDITLTLSQYWTTHDLEDGIYYTTSNPIPDYPDINKVFISNVNQNIYWVAEPDKPVYISHVTGKQRITFCGIDFSGDWGGTLYHTTVDAQVTQP